MTDLLKTIKKISLDVLHFPFYIIFFFLVIIACLFSYIIDEFKLIFKKNTKKDSNKWNSYLL